MKKEDKNETCENEKGLFEILDCLSHTANPLNYKENCKKSFNCAEKVGCEDDKYSRVIKYLASKLFGDSVQKNINEFKGTENYNVRKELYQKNDNDKLIQELGHGVSFFDNSIYMFNTLDSDGCIKSEIKNVNDIKDGNGKRLKDLERNDINELRKIFLGEKESRWCKFKRKVLFLKKRSKQWRQIKNTISKVYETLKDNLEMSLELAKKNEPQLLE